jgi:hypothetical protein
MRPSEANERMSTADFAAAVEQPSTSSAKGADDQSKSRAQERGIANDESRPVVRQDADRFDEQPSSLFPGNEAEQFRGRWSDIQAGFVDEPRRAVEQADSLVAEVMQRLAQVFADERSGLEQHWDRGGETNTEELRLALRRYRSFFDRLLTM